MQRGATFPLERRHSTESPAQGSAKEERAALQRGGRGYFRRGTRGWALQPPCKTKTHTSAWNVVGVPPCSSWENMSGESGEATRSFARCHLPPSGSHAAFTEHQIWTFLLDSESRAQPRAPGHAAPVSCCSVTESTGNLHVRECSDSRCGMEKPNKSGNSH